MVNGTDLSQKYRHTAKTIQKIYSTFNTFFPVLKLRFYYLFESIYLINMKNYKKKFISKYKDYKLLVQQMSARVKMFRLFLVK